MTEKQHTVSESADKIRLKTKIKRGTGTRDQDEIEVNVKGNDPAETVENLNETLIELEGTPEKLRNTQPEKEENND